LSDTSTDSDQNLFTEMIMRNADSVAIERLREKYSDEQIAEMLKHLENQKFIED